MKIKCRHSKHSVKGRDCEIEQQRNSRWKSTAGFVGLIC